MSYTRGQWKAVKNSSWGESHKSQFNDREGYVICVEKRGELTAVVSVIGMPFVEQAEIDANAKLVSAAPELLFQVQQAQLILKVIDPGNPAIKQIADVIQKAEGKV